MRDRNDDDEIRRRFNRRALLVGGTQAAALSLVGWRLFDLQVLGHGRYGPLAEENRISVQLLAPKRGRILDRAGRVLADNDEMFRVVLVPGLAGDPAAVLTSVQRIVSISTEDADKHLRRMKRQSPNLPTVIAEGVSFEQVAQLNLLAPQLPGIRTEIYWRRRYYGGAPVGHIVGYVGNVERFGVDDDAVLRLPEMRIGKSGAEAGFEGIVRGVGGAQRLEVDARGRIIRNLDGTEPAPGRDVTLSIDQALQQIVLARLQRERRAACVVLDVTTGEIAAMASTPAFDAAEVAEGITEQSWQRLIAAEDHPLLNRAVAGQYPPGSTVKMVTALAALKAGLIDAKDRISCDGAFTLADQSYRCWKRGGHGRMTLHEAIRSSCDVYFFELARRVGIRAIAATAHDLGLGELHDCGLPDEKAGLVPDPDWKRGRWNASWLAGETILAGIGQGYMLATPLQLAVMTARIATGRRIKPTLERRVHAGPRAEFSSIDYADTHLELVRAAMLAVVNDTGGTGANAYLGPGRPSIAGKTGTSQVSRASSETAQSALPWGQRDHALFVAYTPAENPRFAAAAIVEHGGSGGATAAPLVRDVLLAVLDRADPSVTGSAADGVVGRGNPGREG